MEEPINYILYGGILAAILVVVVTFLIFQRQFMLFLMINFSDKAVKTTVIEVLEGDTVIVKVPKARNQKSQINTQTNQNLRTENSATISVGDENETTWIVRLIGVDTPESRASLYIDEAPFGKESLAYTQKRVKNKTVILIFDEQVFDKFDKHLAYIYFPSGECLNATLLKEGYGWIRKHAFDIKFEKQFEKAQEKARIKKRGVWNMYVTKGILREEYKETQHYKAYKKRIGENE